jgi:hypothetical protein
LLDSRRTKWLEKNKLEAAIVPLIEIWSENILAVPMNFREQNCQDLLKHFAVIEQIMEMTHLDYRQFFNRLFTPNKTGELWLWKGEFRLYKSKGFNE